MAPIWITMKKIHDIISQLKLNWSIPKNAIHKGEKTYFELVCKFSSERGQVSDNYPFNIPPDLNDFWFNTKEASLFMDIKYGQWGLKIVSPDDALQTTSIENSHRINEYKVTELIIGHFLGDSDKLVIDCDPENFGRIIVSQPIDARENWSIIADSFEEFLNLYIKVEGDKYWETINS